MNRPDWPGRGKFDSSIRLLAFVMVFTLIPVVSWGATYTDGVFQLDDPGGKYTILLTFNGSSEPLPLGYEFRSDVHYFTVSEPYTDAILTWQVSGDLYGSQSLARNSSLSGTWTAVTLNPFRMVIGNYYRLLFTVNDPSTFSGRRTIYFYFALGRPTFPPALDVYTAYPAAIAPGETVYFTCDAHDTGPFGSEELIFRLDVNGDGTYDTSDKLGVLVNPGDDPFRSVRRAEFAVKYNNRGIYRTFCQVENSRQETVTSDALTVSVSDHRLGVVGRPNDNVDLETAIIPPDERFPARYHLTLTELGTGSPVAGEAVTVSIDASSQARLESGLASGSSITVVTDAQGEAGFTYAFLDVPPNDAPLRDRIVIESAALGLHKTIEVSVGLKPRVVKVTASWDSSTSVPRTLGLRIAVVDAFRPGLDLEAWIASLHAETGNHLGFAATTRWLNRPDPDFFQWINDNIRGFTAPPDDLLYTNGRGWLKKINGQYIFQAIDQPLKGVGDNSLPTLTLTAEGLHLFEATLAPVVLPEDAQNPLVDYVKSAVSIPLYFGADVYGAESVFQSLVCSLSPTDADQFLLKSIILDCPLITEAAWVGAWAGAAVPQVLLVAEVADLVCNFMQDNYFNIGAALAGKYLSRLDGLFESGELDLTQEQFALLKTFVLSNSLKKAYDTVNEAEKHFGLTPSAAAAAVSGATAEPLEEPDYWPDGLNPAVMLAALKEMSAGFMSVPQMQGREALAILSAGAVTVESSPQDTLYLQGDEVSVLLYPAGNVPVMAADATVELFRIHGSGASGGTLDQYQASASGDNLLLSFAGEVLQVDRGADGSVDDLIDPVRSEFVFLKGDLNLDGNLDLADAMLALQVAANRGSADGVLMMPWVSDVNQDGRIRLEEVIYILKKVAGIQ